MVILKKPEASKPVRENPRGSWSPEPGWVVVAVVGCGLLVFLRLALYVGRGEVDELDRRILLGLRNATDPSLTYGPPWVGEVVRDFTALGGFAAITFLTLAVAGGLALNGKGRTALTALSAVIGGFAINYALKELFHRARPDLVPHGSYVSSSSFPSGHSLLSAVTYLTLGAVLARVQPTKALKIYVFALAAILTGLVGMSRVYLGVHWPSDVLAGWTAGLIWAALVWWITLRFQRKGTIEPEPPQSD
ncbi:MAG TPA: phosphatase PAP2 family protein [Planctomycetota bacterium]|nr:phosphatase PAP2 family protein [Planctomycetota bacterium]